jgi:hypothetical protein
MTFHEDWKAGAARAVVAIKAVRRSDWEGMSAVKMLMTEAIGG